MFKKHFCYFNFWYWQLFVANQNKPPEVASILVTNKNKLLQFLGNFNSDKGIEYLASLLMYDISILKLFL